MQNYTGSLFLQRFRVERWERRNEWGEVYLARDLHQNRAVSLTILKAEVQAGLLSLQATQQSLQALAHPHAVPFYGTFREQRLTFMAEGYVHGSTLEDLLRERKGRPFPLVESLVFLKSLAEVLDYLHRFGLVHLHVRPSNIWVDNDGRVLLAGLGFTHTVGAVLTDLNLSGSPAHLAPEVIRRQGITPAADIYSLGLLLFELLTGRHPFFGGGSPALTPEVTQRLVTAHLNEVAQDPRALNPAIPPGLAQVIQTALAKDAAQRYQNVQEMVELAYAVSGLAAAQVPDRLPGFGPPLASAGGTLAVAPAPYTYGRGAAGPAEVGGTQVVPPGRPAEGYPSATQAVPGVAPSYGYESPYERGAVPPYPLEGSPPPSWMERLGPFLPYVVGIGAALIVLLCLGGLFLAFGSNLGGLLFAPASATPSPMPTATFTVEVVQPTSPRPLEPNLLATDTLPPTNTPLPPTDTPRPTPTNTLAGYYTVTIWNYLGFPIYVFRDGRLMGTDPIPPNRYIWYRGVPAGVHIFVFCQTPDGRNCTKERTYNIVEDTTIYVR